MSRFQYIQNWMEAELLQLPSQEDHEHEYKSSLTRDEALGNKISVAASAFWNSGGGIFVAGIDDQGQVDGGISDTVGRQSRRDWVDQQINKTQPLGPYILHIIPSTSSIKRNHSVILIGFDESSVAPHMAYDRKYYIRAGAHSEAASHFLVEAIRARHVVQTPVLRAILQRSQRKSELVNLLIMVVNDSVAMNVEITFDPLPKTLKEHFADHFPLKIPVIDRLNPFSLELFWWGARPQTFGNSPVELQIQCVDLLGRMIDYRQIIDAENNIDPMTIGDTDLKSIEKAIKAISGNVNELNRNIKAFIDAGFSHKI